MIAGKRSGGQEPADDRNPDPIEPGYAEGFKEENRKPTSDENISVDLSYTGSNFG
jgi:hypothetical protein